jgi:hypothetical protein
VVRIGAAVRAGFGGDGVGGLAEALAAIFQAGVNECGKQQMRGERAGSPLFRLTGFSLASLTFIAFGVSWLTEGEAFLKN